MTNNLKDIQQVKALIAKGKAAGYLTVEEVSKSVPAEMNSPENLEEIISGINTQIWEDLGMTQQEWFQTSVTYKKPKATEDDANEYIGVRRSPRKR